MRKSGESGRTAGTERVKVAMQVPKDANISEWKEETRTPTPVTIMEEGQADEKREEVPEHQIVLKEGQEQSKDGELEKQSKADMDESEWRRGLGSV